MVVSARINAAVSTPQEAPPHPPRSYFLLSFTPTISFYLKWVNYFSGLHLNSQFISHAVAMLIIPIRLTELISFCGSGVLAFDVFVSGVLVMFPMLTETAGGMCLFPVPTSC